MIQRGYFILALAKVIILRDKTSPNSPQLVQPNTSDEKVHRNLQSKSQAVYTCLKYSLAWSTLCVDEYCRVNKQMDMIQNALGPILARSISTIITKSPPTCSHF